jgi:hypothetical protein
MVAGTSRSAFSPQSIVAYAIAYGLAAVVLIIGLVSMAVLWLALGAWMLASLTVLVIDRAVGERTPRPDHPEDNLGAIFHGSTTALLIICVLGVAALVVGFVAR